ncbi:MAG TPA: PASTA domain-containing protein [Spirochaetia bacterium]|nr:PASTA domain-containing protein [Spirochaetia bacterium]
MRELFWKVRDWLERASDWTVASVRKILPNADDSSETRNLKVTVFLFVGIIGLMLVIGLVTFSIAVRGQDETLVPNLEGKDVLDALSDLQSKELYPDIQEQYSTSYDRNIVISQSPAPGTVVKAGKRVTLRVSRGPVIDKVENYVGMTLDDVKIHLQTLFATHSPNLIIKEPILYRFENGAAPGIVLAQSPKAGTPIAGLTYLELVVSQDQAGQTMLAVGDYVGVSFQEAIADLTKAGIPFAFTVQKSAAGKAPGSVIAQNPASGEKITYDQIVQLTMAAPGDVGKGNVFGLFQYSLPQEPIAVDISLDVVSGADRRNVLTMKHPGGPIAVPYIVPDGSDLVLTVLEQEVARQKATPLGF